MHIRTAKLEDVAQLANVHVLAWRSAYAGHMPAKALDELDFERRKQNWQGWLTEPGPGTTYVLEDAGQLLGFSVFGPSRDLEFQGKDIGEILAINIHPDYWGCGYGRRLCLAIFEAASQRRWNKLTLWTLATNKRAQGFYLSMGFCPDGGEREDFIVGGHALAELRYQKKILGENA